MSDLRELYQDVILDHSRHPRNVGALEDATRRAEGINPLCGDQLSLFIRLSDGVIQDVRFQGKGCAIFTASASMMTQTVKGRRIDEATTLFQRFHDVLTCPTDKEVDLTKIGKLAVLSGVREFPLRVKCASLAWHTLRAALEGKGDAVTTE